MSALAARRFSARYVRGLAATLALSLTAAAAGVALLGVSGWFLTGAALTTAALGFNLFGPSALVRGLSFLRIGARYGEKLVGHDLTLRALADLRESLFRRLIPRVPLQGIGLRHGDLVSRLVGDVEALDAVIITAVGPLVTVLLVGLGLGTILAWLLQAAVPVFAVGYGSAALLVPAALVLATRRSGRARVETRARLRMAVLDGIEGHADLRLFDRAAEACGRVAAEAERGAALARRQGRWTAGASALIVLIAGLTTLGVFVDGVEAVQRQAIGGPALIGLLLAVLASFEPVGLMTRNVGTFGAALAAAERLRGLTQAAPAVNDPPDPVPLPPGASLVLDDVSFAYRSERLLLDRVSLACEPGSRTAIVGESGCGKSTLLDLVLRLADPDDGTVRVAGVDVSCVAQADLHARLALMGQTTPVFLGTIRDNLRLGRPDASDVALWDALARARLVDFVRGLPHGLDTWCGEGGRTLSAGQARRLCLARTLLTRAAILLLDEPTSGLDRETEQAFLEDLGGATAGRTVLLVTHATLPPGTVDRVVRLTDGRLDACGQAAQPATASSASRSTIVT